MRVYIFSKSDRVKRLLRNDLRILSLTYKVNDEPYNCKAHCREELFHLVPDLLSLAHPSKLDPSSKQFQDL